MADEETPALETAEEDPSITSLLALSDDELCDLLGLTDTLENAKKNLTEMSKLTGKQREYADERIKSMLTPNVYPNEFKYILESAQRRDKQTGEQARCDCSPASVID